MTTGLPTLANNPILPRRGTTSRKSSRRLPTRLGTWFDRPVTLPPGRAIAGADRVPSRRSHDGDDRRRLRGGQDHASARRDNNINLALDELGRNLSGALGSTLSPAILNCDCTTLNPAEFDQSLYKSGGPLALGRSRGRAQEPD